MQIDWPLSLPKEELSAPLPVIPRFNDDETLRKLSDQQQQTALSDALVYGISSDEIEDALVARDVSQLEKKGYGTRQKRATGCFHLLGTDCRTPDARSEKGIGLVSFRG